MASATATARAEPGGREPDEEPQRRPLFRFGGSRLGGFILVLNLLSLLILFGGALAINEWRPGLIEARQESLTVQAELLANVLREEGVTRGEPTPELDPIRASIWLTDRFIPAGQRVRLYDVNGLLLVDIYQVTEAIGGRPLPDAQPAGTATEDAAKANLLSERRVARADSELAAEVAAASAALCSLVRSSCCMPKSIPAPATTNNTTTDKPNSIRMLPQVSFLKV